MIASLIRYPLARFISEHGFQSFPSFESYVPVTAPVDHSRDSWLLFYRLHWAAWRLAAAGAVTEIDIRLRVLEYFSLLYCFELTERYFSRLIF